MKKLLLALLVFLAAGAASAETCTFASGASTWSAIGTITGVGVTGCTPTADDSFIVANGSVVTTTGDIGTAAAPVTGVLTVQSGGAINFATTRTFYMRNSIVFESGSCPNDSCSIQGTALQAIGAPTVTYPTATTINFDFDSIITAGGVLPWTISAAGAGDSTTIHAATATLAGTQIYIDWEKFGATLTPQLVGSEQLNKEFVDGVGIWLEVTATNPAGNDFTVTLPPVLANTLLYHYAVAEAATGNILQNIRGGTSWTVADVEVRENSEGKIRYETVIAAADAPFNSDWEFEGYLACAQGTDRCLRITTTEADYALPVMPGTAVAAGSEMFVTWSNPEDPNAYKWTTGTELDIYYVKVNPGDTLRPINPVRFDFTGSTAATQTSNNSFRVRDGSGLLTIRNVVFQDANMAGDIANEGAVNIENYASLVNQSLSKTLENVLLEGCNSGDGTTRVADGVNGGLPACIRVEDPDGGTGVDLGATNFTWNRVTIRFPQEPIDWVTNPLLDEFGQTAIHMRESTGDAISSSTDFAAGEVPNWTNNSLRKIRIEGFTTGFGVANTGILTQCPDDAFIQDAIMLHSRSRKGDDSGANLSHYGRRGEDQMESFGVTPTCGYDRFVIGGPNSGTSLGPVRHARRGRSEFSSFVTFGGTGKTENGATTTDFGSGRRPYVGYAVAHNLTSGPEGHTHSFPAADSDGVMISNFITDGNLGPISASYYQRFSWYRSTNGAFHTATCGQFIVGAVVIGGGGLTYYNGFNECEGSYTDIVYKDNFMVNLGRTYNNSSDQTCLADGTGSGSVYPCRGGSSIFPIGPITSNAMNIPAPTVRFSNNLIHRGDRSGAWVGCCTNWGSFTESIHTTDLSSDPSFYFTDSTFINGSGTGNRVISFSDDRVATLYLENVWAEGGATLNTCQQTLGTYADTDRQDCNFTAAGGLDYSPDDSPHGAFDTYMSGDLTSTFRSMAPIGKSGGTGDPTTAVPAYAGIVAWEWPHAWATPEVITYGTGEPDRAYIPGKVARRMGGGGGGGAESFAPAPF